MQSLRKYVIRCETQDERWAVVTVLNELGYNWSIRKIETKELLEERYEFSENNYVIINIHGVIELGDFAYGEEVSLDKFIKLHCGQSEIIYIYGNGPDTFPVSIYDDIVSIGCQRFKQSAILETAKKIEELKAAK